MIGTSTPSRAVRAVAVSALVAEIAIHIYLAPDHLHEIPYIGSLFLAVSVLLGAVVVALAVVPDNALAWLAGAALCVGMAAAFVASRTFGLPNFQEAWTSDNWLGLASLVPEAAYLACWRYGRPARTRALQL